MTHTDKLAAAKHWLDVHARATFAAEAMGNAASFASIDAFPVKTHAPSAGFVTGAKGAAAALAGDSALNSAGNSLAALTDTLIAHPITGATSVLNLAMGGSGYDPLLPATKGNSDGFFLYTKRVVQAPFFHLTFSDQKSLHHETSDWDKLVGEIVDLFEGVIDENRTRIVSGLKALAHRATSTNDKTQTENLFCQQVVSVNSDSQVSVGIYSSSVSMTEHDGKHTTRQADYTINRALFTFDTVSWPHLAGMVAAKKVTGVTDWLTAVTSQSAGHS